MNHDEVARDIYTAIHRANEWRSPEDRLVCAEGTTLYGSGGGLDSLELVSLILDVEAAVNKRAGTDLVLADEHAMSQRHNPFRNVQSLVDYIMSRLSEAASCPIAPSS